MKNNWILLSIASAIFGALFTLTAKIATTSFHGLTYVFYLFSCQAIILWFILIWNGSKVTSTKTFFLSLSGGLFAVLGNFCEYQSIKYAPNIGYAKSIICGQIILVAIVSKFLFKDQTISLKSFVGIVFSIIGIFLISIFQDDLGEITQLNWIWWALASLTAFSLMILVVKKMSLNEESTIVLFNLLFAGAMISWIAAIVTDYALILEARYIIVIVALSILAALINIFLFRSIAIAPNVGYPSAINTGQIVIVSVLSIFLFQGQSLSLLGVGGVLLVVFGITLIVLGSKA